MSYYVLGQRVLARVVCGARFKDHEWAAGVITYTWGPKYGVRLDVEHDGKREWYFSTRGVVDDNPRNRRSRDVV